MTKETDIAWLAGIVDGEGCFSIKNPVRRKSPRTRGDGHGRDCYQLWLVVCNTSRDMITRVTNIIESITDGYRPSVRSVWKGAGARKSQFWVHVARKQALLKVTEALLPHLTNKRVEAEVFAWYLRKAVTRKSYWQTELDMLVLRTLTVVKKHSGEVPAEVEEILREIIPNEAFLRVEPLRSTGSERLETTRVSLTNNPAHECPTDDEIH